MKTKEDFIKLPLPAFASQSDREVFVLWMEFQKVLWEEHPEAAIRACELRKIKEDKQKEEQKRHEEQ